MDYQTRKVVMGNTLLAALAAALTARPAAALLTATPKLRLGKAPGVVLAGNTPLSALTAVECDWSGYVAGGYAFASGGTVNTLNPGVAVIMSQLFVATTATPFVPNDIKLWWVDDGTNFLFGENIPDDKTPVMGKVGDWLQLDVLLPEDTYRAVAA